MLPSRLVTFCLFVCINAPRAALDHISYLSLLCWNSHKKPLNRLFSLPFRAQELSQTLPSGLSESSASLKSLRFPLCLGSFSHRSGKQPSFLPRKDHHEPHNQPRYRAFSKGFYWLRKSIPVPQGFLVTSRALTHLLQACHSS